MSLPRPEDLTVEKGTEEERAEAIQVAVRVVEMLTTRAVLYRDLQQEILLGGVEPCALLDHYPADHLKIDGVASLRGFWVEEALGVVGANPSIPPKGYHVDYRVGVEENVPVILEELVLMIAEYQLGGDKYPADMILDVAWAAAQMLEPETQEREHYNRKTV